MKRGKKMILLLLLLAVTVGGYFGVQQLDKKESVSETSGSFDLTAKQAEDVQALSWTMGETAWSFKVEDGVWTTAEEPSWPVKQDVLQELAETLVSLQANRKLEDVGSLADYGLEQPAITVKAGWKDGSETVYSMGDATPFADGYYLSLSGQDATVYTIASSLITTFNKTQKDMVAMEEIPAVAEVTALSIGNTLNVVRESESRTVDPDQLWYDAETGKPLDGAKVDSLADKAKGIAWSELAAAAADEATLREWGLDEENAVAVRWSGGEEAAEVWIGTTDGDGNYYARLPGSAMVYTVKSDDADSLLSAEKDSLWISAILPMPYESLAYAEFVTEKGSYRLEPAAAEKADAENSEAAGPEDAGTDGSEQTGETAPEDAEKAETLKNLWGQVVALKGTERTDAEASGDRVLSIRAVHQNGMEITVVFTACSADQYLAQEENGGTMLVAADQVDAIIRVIRTLQ